MRRVDLLDMIEEGENLYIEFKQKFSSPEKIAKEMIAFANTKGGYMIFGVDDNRRVVGVESEKSESTMITEAAEQYCTPPVLNEIHYMEIDGKELVIAEIPESPYKPHRIRDYKEEFDILTAQVYIRIEDKSMPASKEMLRIMRAEVSGKPLVKYTIGDLEKKAFDLLSKNSYISVQLFSEKCNISQRRASRTLVKMVRAGLLVIHTKDNGEEFFTDRLHEGFKKI
ncbi:MAG: ATP-binding protein [Ignavibacteriaceae bacterium]|nr:ATP-binding protein [Ignavibacteriaceae bacterium]